jgi:P27 family predicted phage terminase small subunit
MTPEKYLSKLGLEYFKNIEEILKGRGMDREEFSIELSQLAKQYAMFHECVEEEKKKGKYVEAKTGWQSEAPWVIRQDKALANINKLSPKFGLTPADYEKIKGAIKAPEVKSDLELMM